MRGFLPILLGLALLATLTACAGPAVAPHHSVHEVTPRLDVRGPRVLVVVAHPDDEVAFAGTLYKTSTLLDGVVDIAMLTNGEGGFKYATLAESIYGVELTDEAVGREHLPAIRLGEEIAGARILRVRRIYWFDELDHRYTRDVDEILGEDAKVWDLAAVRAGLDAILRAGRYDFVLTHLPVPATHAHHKAATILALEATTRLPPESRPVVLGAGPDPEEGTFSVLPGYPTTRIRSGVEPFAFDRTAKFGYREQLDYRIVANWVIAEHKSQGTMQLFMNAGEREFYRLYDQNPPYAERRARAYFKRLEAPQFRTKTYGPSAGVPVE